MRSVLGVALLIVGISILASGIADLRATSRHLDVRRVILMELARFHIDDLIRVGRRSVYVQVPEERHWKSVYEMDGRLQLALALVDGNRQDLLDNLGIATEGGATLPVGTVSGVYMPEPAGGVKWRDVPARVLKVQPGQKICITIPEETRAGDLGTLVIIPTFDMAVIKDMYILSPFERRISWASIIIGIVIMALSIVMLVRTEKVGRRAANVGSSPTGGE